VKKLKMARGVTLTFQEGCNKYLENCRQRNLREGTINHYRQSYLYFYKFFDPKMPPFYSYALDNLRLLSYNIGSFVAYRMTEAFINRRCKRYYEIDFKYSVYSQKVIWNKCFGGAYDSYKFEGQPPCKYRRNFSR